MDARRALRAIDNGVKAREVIDSLLADMLAADPQRYEAAHQFVGQLTTAHAARCLAGDTGTTYQEVKVPAQGDVDFLRRVYETWFKELSRPLQLDGDPVFHLSFLVTGNAAGGLVLRIGLRVGAEPSTTTETS